jgi:hypothetical protein
MIAKDRKSQIPVQRTNYGHSDYGGAFHQTPNSPPTLLSSQSLTYLTQYYRTENHSGKCKAGPTTQENQEGVYPKYILSRVIILVPWHCRRGPPDQTVSSSETPDARTTAIVLGPSTDDQPL